VVLKNNIVESSVCDACVCSLSWPLQLLGLESVCCVLWQTSMSSIRVPRHGHVWQLGYVCTHLSWGLQTPLGLQTLWVGLAPG
jgi:hypothetical protein